MSKSNNYNGSQSGGRGTATPSRPGGNWPSTTGRESGGGRGNAAPLFLIINLK